MHASTQSTRTWTILSLIEWATRYLDERGFEDSRLNVELLLANTLDLQRISLYTSFDRPLNSDELQEFKLVFQRRLDHEPLQYILGKAEFMGISLDVNRSVLVPRPETEELVQKALEWIKDLDTPRVDILDIGTGSGNIPIAFERFSPRTYITSIDVSTEALAVASRNVEQNECSRIVLKHQNVFESAFPVNAFDMIISNPPYVSAEEFVALQPEVKDFEPVIATTDNADGLSFPRRICQMAVRSLRAGGAVFIEVAYNQGPDVRRMATDAGLVGVEVFRDMAGHERILQGFRAA